MTLIYEQHLTGGLDGNDYRVSFGSSFESVYTFNNITKITVYLKKTGDPEGTVKACLWSGAALPSNPTEESTNTLDVETITGDLVGYDFDFTGATSLTGDFKIGLTFSETDTTNFVYISLSSGSLSNRSSYRSEPTGTSPTSWISMSTPFTLLVYSGSAPSAGGPLLPPPYAVHTI